MSDASAFFAAPGAAFPPPSHDDWRKLVDKALKGAPFERLFVRTLDGLEIQPLYPRNASGAPALEREQPGVWRMLTRLDHPDAAMANAQACADLEGGATGLHLVFAGSAGAYGFGLAGADIEAALAGLDLANVALELDVGANASVAERVADLIEQQGLAPASARVSFGLRADDPELATRVLHLAARGFEGPFCVADARPVHAGGGTEAQELAFALASAVTMLRTLEAGGLELEAARRAISFRMTCDADQFASLSKLRALRRLWARVEEACGLAPQPAHIHAETAWRMMTRRDPWVNALRTTVAAFSAGVAGADALSVLPFTQALGLPDAFARRLARNTQLVLVEEAHLARVADPAAGAGGFEALTQGLCDKAWALFQEIERAGGLGATMSAGLLQAHVSQAREARLRDVARRKTQITGTNEFPNLAESEQSVLAPLPQAFSGESAFPAMRLAEPFERLRDASDARLAQKGARPQVFLAALGAATAAAPRVGFARGAFEAGGLQAIVSAQLHDADEAARAFAASGASLACLCGADSDYADAPALARALKGASARFIALAGRPGEHENALREAGLDDFMFIGSDIVATLTTALQRAD